MEEWVEIKSRHTQKWIFCHLLSIPPTPHQLSCDSVMFCVFLISGASRDFHILFIVRSAKKWNGSDMKVRNKTAPADIWRTSRAYEARDLFRWQNGGKGFHAWKTFANLLNCKKEAIFQAVASQWSPAEPIPAQPSVILAYIKRFMRVGCRKKLVIYKVIIVRWFVMNSP